MLPFFCLSTFFNFFVYFLENRAQNNIKTRKKWESHEKDSNDTKEGRAKNRRVGAAVDYIIKK